MKSKCWFYARRLCQPIILRVNQHYSYRVVNSSSLSSRIRKKMNVFEKDNMDIVKPLFPERGPGPSISNYVVSIEGNIACGKTEMVNYFNSTHNCEVLEEPVTKWREIQGCNALELMYQDPERWGMTLQTYIQLTMLKNHVLPQEKPVRLIERSIFSAKYCFVENLFQSGKMSEIEYLILTEWFEWIIKTQNIHLDLIVYLRTDPNILHERIMKRSRHEETSIPLDYLKTLHQLHEDWLVHKKFPCPAKVLIIDANSALEKMPEVYEQHRSRIVQTF